MFSFRTFVFVGLLGLLKLSTAAPDSAGIVEMKNGLAYGGIPYGSVSGMLTKYPGFTSDQANPFQGTQWLPSQTIRPIVITPNFRATRLLGRVPPLQIRNSLGVIAPGVVGTITRIGY
ncbi:uncharacterized protein [Prorops nasuta]|uniref:uncharacterized protein n=1 Tax=Prorops nasuta TaxID=863751 RepID=UPI0034CF376D